MHDLSIAEDIVPIGEFKANASRFLKRVRHGPRPLVITQNGRPAGVVLSPREYDRIVDKERLLESIAAGLYDAEAGRSMDTSALRERMLARRNHRQLA